MICIWLRCHASVTGIISKLIYIHITPIIAITSFSLNIYKIMSNVMIMIWFLRFVLSLLLWSVVLHCFCYLCYCSQLFYIVVFCLLLCCSKQYSVCVCSYMCMIDVYVIFPGTKYIDNSNKQVTGTCIVWYTTWNQWWTIWFGCKTMVKIDL